MTKRWESYEEVAVYLLNQFSQEFGLDRIEGKQSVVGNRSRTTWEIDAKGVRTSDGGFIIVECRRYTKSKQNQERIGGLAYRIIDTDAIGGIIVSPHGLQEGAEKVAAAEDIINVRLNENSTVHDFAMNFLNKFMVGLSITTRTSCRAEVQVIDQWGNDITQR